MEKSQIRIQQHCPEHWFPLPETDAWGKMMDLF
jgi:hypothetical protein